MENTANFEATLRSIQSWSIDDQRRLAEAILEQVAADRNEAELTDAEMAELDRRLADDDANPDKAIPWEFIKAEALARSKK